MYAATHPDYAAKNWHVFVCYLVLTWASVATVLFANRALPALNNIGLFLIVVGLIITIIVCAILPGVNGAGHASNAFVWKDWSADIGYSSNTFVFMMGMLSEASLKPLNTSHETDRAQMLPLLSAHQTSCLT